MLHNSVLLHLQWELQTFEKRFGRINKWEVDKGKKQRLKSKTLDEKLASSERHELLKEIKTKLE